MAPELIYRKIGVVSYKADVYSFGQLLLAIAAGRRKINATDHSSRVYFSSWIHERIVDKNRVEDLDLGDNLTEDGKKIFRRIVLVALWCVQWKPAHRPSMQQVVEMLESSIEQDLKLPPKPLYYPQDSYVEEEQSAFQDGTGESLSDSMSL
ncbi:hypothetical protein M9H77_03157 [Catharanthus roseus]|uniref:Uncharacterized protein n=1 Tax=Catharanthus roseus TaxID=4058 RepID=A0ACC0CAW2_CATRO|nr:hypothetical protein M9H77_03157 [Catharanthus roseus]